MGAYGTMDEAANKEQMRALQDYLATLDTVTINDDDWEPYITLTDDAIDRLARWLWGLDRHWLAHVHCKCRTATQSVLWLWGIACTTMDRLGVEDKIGSEACERLEDRVYRLIAHDVDCLYAQHRQAQAVDAQDAAQAGKEAQEAARGMWSNVAFYR